ncbi:nucleotide exchange factor GrpE [Microlunatus flavus]|uniref:Molecular chaperone GrpE (Heat shock protein) n=1 Tax=Microlunatus flavus TaxID=1036181 RepID=A0A1H9D4K9_9ACTN|nr:nucleotide exchange factor GrpE [Microlunatus flavus]SEQ08426.1 Molecular chaperone GrpE (heat shock protein) [Microlunatus flavus]
MTADDQVTLATVSEQLDGLTDLFRRRLLDDRAKQAVIEDLGQRLNNAEAARSAAALKPIVHSLSMVIERLRTSAPDADLVESIGHELEDVLESVVGVAPIAPIKGDPVDPLRHEVVAAHGDGTELRVAELRRGGYEKDGIVLKPARVTAVRVPPANDRPADGR